MKVFIKSKIGIFLLLLLLFFFIKSIIVPWTFFAASFSRMDYFDLGVISGFLSNTAHGKLFYVDEWGLNHLSVHWTPTLFLLVPFYRVFETQFLIVLFGNIICGMGLIYFILFIYRFLLSKFENKLILFSCVFLVTMIFYSNKYINANFIAGHFEIMFVGFSLITLTMLLENRPLYYIFIPFILALGVRQDMGLFLFFQILSLFLISKNVVIIEKKTKINMMILLIFCIAYVFVSVKYFMPLMGASENLRANEFWSQWGNTWPEIIQSVLFHPLKVIKAVLTSGAPAFNESFFYLGIFSPLQWICVQIPGLLLFLAKTTDKNHLFWYNSAMLIPGIYIAVMSGFFNVVLFIVKKYPSKIKIISIIMLILTLILVFRMNRATNSPDYFYKSINRLNVFEKVSVSINKQCKITPIIFSTDVKSFAFLPNSNTKYLLGNYKKSQIVIAAHLSRDDFSYDNDFESHINFFRGDCLI